MERKKGVFLSAMGLLVLVAGIYLAGYATLWLLGLDVSPRWDTYLRYLRALDQPQVAPYATKIKAGGALGFGVPLLAWLAMAIPLLRSPRAALHGDARFARAGDLARHGMFAPAPEGIVVGRLGGKLVRLSGQQFVILAAPTRSGKGVGVVIPNLLEYQGSVVVLDIKQENFDLTSGWRASQGQEIYLFNPFAEDRRTHRWNPLSYVSSDPAFRISDLQAIAAMLYPDGDGKDKFWISHARNAFLAFTLYLFENHDEERRRKCPPELMAFPTLGRVHRLSAGNGSQQKQYLQELSAKPFLSEHARTAFANLLSQADETFSSILGTFKEPLNAFVNPLPRYAPTDLTSVVRLSTPTVLPAWVTEFWKAATASPTTSWQPTPSARRALISGGCGCTPPLRKSPRCSLWAMPVTAARWTCVPRSLPPS